MRPTSTRLFCLATTITTLARAQSDSDPYELVDQLARVLHRVEQEYVEPAPRAKLVQGAIEGMVGALDPHSAYMPPEEYDEFKADTSGQFAGIGVEVDLRGGQVTVIAPIGGSPAERAGLRSGDRIVSLNGVAPESLPLTEIVHRMRGRIGSGVHLVVRRPGRALPLEFNIVRDRVQVPSVYVRQLEGGITYVRITAFQAGTHGELLEKMAGARSETGFRGLVLDLRQNPGGLVSEAVAVSDEFLGDGLLFFTRQRARVVDRVGTSDNGHFEHTPMVTLVDEGTASAAEILAGALKDRQRSVLVGARTFGKGTVQTIMDLPGGAGLRLTTLRYYTPAGTGIQASGIVPDEFAAEADVLRADPPREADLPNHLPSDATPAPTKQATDAEQPITSLCSNPKPLISLAERIQRLPASPSDSDDQVLAKGFRLLRSRLGE